MIVHSDECPAFSVHADDGLDEEMNPLVDLTVRTPNGYLGLALRPSEALALANGLLTLVASLERSKPVSGASGAIRRAISDEPRSPIGGPA